MSVESIVFPVWNIENKNQINGFKKNKTSKEISQTIKIEIKGLRKSETKPLKSPDLQFKELGNSVWFLTIETRIQSNESNHYYLGLFLHLLSKQFERFSGHLAKFDISLIDKSRGKVWSKTSRELYFNRECGWGWNNFAKVDDIFEISKRSKDLNLILTITSIQNLSLHQNKESLCSGDSTKLDEFAFTHDLMNDKEYCDIRFVFGDTDFTVHSKLLSAKSTVFKKLFLKNKEISITETDSSTFYELILFLYRGYSPNIEKYCKNLLIEAHNYRIPSLKYVCDNLCFRQLSPEQAIDALIFAEKYKTFSSKLRTICFVAIHLNQIKNLSEELWNQFEAENGILVKEILEISKMKCQCHRHH